MTGRAVDTRERPRPCTTRRANGVLVPDERPALYVYEESTASHTQRGLLGAVGLVPAAAGIVLPHEDTMADPVADRLALTEATESNLEPIFLLYDGGGVASAAVRDVDCAEPLVEFVSDDGIGHRLWALQSGPARQDRCGSAGAPGRDRGWPPPLRQLSAAPGRSARRRKRPRPLGPRAGHAGGRARLRPGGARNPPRGARVSD